MTWEYSQRTGELKHNGEAYAHGYSGRGIGKNNSLMENVADTGPIPRGYYWISGHNNHKGPWTVVLKPMTGTHTFGRSAFRIHGDNPHTIGNSSEGCIVINGAELRQNIATSSDNILVVR